MSSPSGWERSIGPTAAVTALALVVSVMAAPAARAGEPDWPNRPYEYRAVDQDLAAVLREFGKNTGIGVRISPKVSGTVQNTPSALPPRAFLDRLTASHGLVWYYDGQSLHINSADEMQTRIVDLPVDLEQFERLLAEVGALDTRYPLRASSRQNLALLTAPPAYLNIVDQAAEMLRRRTRAEVAVFRGGVGGGAPVVK